MSTTTAPVETIDPATLLGHYGLALLSVVLNSLQYFITLEAQVYMRRKTFDGKYMRRFDEIHMKEVGGKAPQMGYPDMGNGRYSVDLSYDQWFTFNNWQRAHYNYLEQLTPTLIWILISCAYQPLAAAILGFFVFIGRTFYAIGYCSTPNSRVIGAIIVDLGFLGLFVLSCVSVAKWAQFA